MWGVPRSQFARRAAFAYGRARRCASPGPPRPSTSSRHLQGRGSRRRRARASPSASAVSRDAIGQISVRRERDMNVSLKRMLGAAIVAGSLAAGAAAQAETTLQFYFPVAVGGPITKIIDGMVADFEKANPAIKVKPIYAGSYQDTITKVLTAIK